ncbi:MAG: hypothetical protein ISS23_00755 [Nanoarchaeota archaeon]|nr:hypothetical protein [Nanoarchaeota archaeon]
MKRIAQKIIILLALTILLSFGVNAFAVTLPYMGGDKTLIMYPGGSTEFTIGLQNMGDADHTVMVTIEDGNEIARIIDQENVYKVPKGTNDRVARLKIDIPPNTPLGKEYRVRFIASDVVEASGDMIQVASGLSDYFIVRVGSLPEEKPVTKVITKEGSAIDVWWIIGVVTLIIIVISLIFYSRLRKRKK